MRVQTFQRRGRNVILRLCAALRLTWQSGNTDAIASDSVPPRLLPTVTCRYGYLRDYPIERVVRDLRVHTILEGTNEIMRTIISKEIEKLGVT